MGALRTGGAAFADGRDAHRGRAGRPRSGSAPLAAAVAGFFAGYEWPGTFAARFGLGAYAAGVATIVVLNGASSSGKTSVARAFQEVAGGVFLNFSIDTILYTLPRSVVEGVERGVCLGRARFVELARAFCGCVRELAAQGHDLVIDHAIVSQEEAEMLLDATSSHRVVLVGLECAVEVLAERERRRGDRKAGLAASQASRVHQWLEYDLVIDTAQCTPEEAARRIVGALPV